ncbi:MAG TPA: zf-HC2 domain-containing protein, partial [Polyangia bacterium]|nr:zf-HC2 domain-containing protein [Polyangia bacterium]
MTLSHDDANARLLDLAYGEGTAEERAALEAHVAACAACTAELAALGDTRARLRTALEDAPAPARVHARLL